MLASVCSIGGFPASRGILYSLTASRAVSGTYGRNRSMTCLKLLVLQTFTGSCMNKLTLLALMAMASSPIANAGDIYIGAPLISGNVSRSVNRSQTGYAHLSPPQLETLTTWLGHHRSGWSGMLTEATMEPCPLQVNLKHSDGATTSICVIARANGGHYLRVTGPGKWAYRSFGGMFRSWAATRELSDPELAAFESLVPAS